MFLHLCLDMISKTLHGKIGRLKVVIYFHDVSQAVQHGIPSSWFIQDVHCSLDHTNSEYLLNRELVFAPHDQFPGQRGDVK